MAKQDKIFDVLIVGGGMVGASLAVALEPLNIKVGMIEAVSFGASNQPSYDDRAIALSYGSSRIFSGMGVWDNLQEKTTEIKVIEVSDRGHFGTTRLSAKQEKVPALGYLVESRVLGKQLYEQLKKCRVEQFVPMRVTGVEQGNDSLTISIQQAQNKEDKKGKVTKDKTKTIQTRLLVAADGTHSPIREMSGIEVKISDYQQSAIIANVSTEKPHNNKAIERFTAIGPIALLPMSGNRCSLVWTHSTKNGMESVDETMAMDDAAFLKKLNEEFGHRLGRFTKVGNRSYYPLSLVTSKMNTAKRTVVIGNASHTLHPVAGQGLNLAMRDIAVLADLIAEHLPTGDVGTDTLLQAYEKQRAGDLKTTVRYTDSLVRLFSNDNFLLGHARAGGLLAVDRLPPLRKWLTKQSMGINYRQSRLARGLSLRRSSLRSDTMLLEELT